ncbi:uncharacterized protein LOC134180639 [Corticium candelabrum]|uniref:uncharacterized protein LOC134180639 n=1 Tax=Corticium candelabrum TaxID=121492 RepID=UPI002E26E83A|nr:uncharacterized protein LOC134180639 [Corticium candelabrum]
MGQRLTKPSLLCESEEDDVPPTATVQSLSLLLPPISDLFGPIIVVGGLNPSGCVACKIDFQDFHPSIQMFCQVSQVQNNVCPMELHIKGGYPTTNYDTEFSASKDGTANKRITVTHPGMKCQVAVTLRKSPLVKMLANDCWEVIIVQVFKSNSEVRSYGDRKSPESANFTQNQYFKVGDCPPYSYPASILDICNEENVCSIRDPAYCTTARQPLSCKAIEALNGGKMIFGKLSGKDMPQSSARLAYNPKTETDNNVCDFFKTYKDILTAKTYYLNKIEKYSTIITYLAIYNTATSEIYTPMAVEWNFRYNLCRTEGTDNFTFSTCGTTSNQPHPTPWILNVQNPSHPFPLIDRHLLELPTGHCSNSKDCKRYATFNNSISTYFKLLHSQSSITETRV